MKTVLQVPLVSITLLRFGLSLLQQLSYFAWFKEKTVLCPEIYLSQKQDT